MRKARIQKLRAVLESEELDAVLITDPANVFYFSGFAGTPGDASLLITANETWILTDSRYTLQAAVQCPDYVLLGNSASDLDSVADVLSAGRLKAGFENESISYRLWRRVTEVVQSVRWVPMNSKISVIRFVKDEEEQRKIEKACEIACEALAQTIPLIQVGISEQEIATELEYRMKKIGASGSSFETIVASGVRSALPHGVASSKTICKGDPITIDFGAVYGGYCSDMTRTFFAGDLTAELRHIYQTVLLAQETAIREFRYGMSACDLDALSRRVIAEAGYGKYFTHSLGHGVGVEIHEGVSISRRDVTPLTEGMVFSVEPGIYIENVGGVRIEDLVICEKSGLRVMTGGVKKELAIL